MATPDIPTNIKTPEVTPAKSIPKSVEDQKQKPKFTQVDLPDTGDGREALEQIAQNERLVSQSMQENEDQYLENFAKDEKDESTRRANKDGLKIRYDDDRTSSKNIKADVLKFCKQRGIKIDQLPKELQGLVFSEDNQGKTDKALTSLVEQFYKRAEASINPEKFQLLQNQTEQFLKLLRQAQAEGSVSNTLSAEDVYRLTSENIAILAYQDRIASENLLGDHGLRHLVGHNIRVSMELADQLSSQGTPISAKDRLILHQTMIYHDLGYAVAPVAEAIRDKGPKGQDSGHNVLAAKIMKEQAVDRNSPLSKVFSDNDFSLIHQGILYHDKNAEGKPAIAFTVGENQTAESRKNNLLSVVRTADNTHAFEDKLPELLYRIPEAMKIMKLLRTAGEIDSVDSSVMEGLKNNLVYTIRSKDLPKDDEMALLSAAKSLNKDSYKFTVDRVCGNKPQYEINNQGKLKISVAVSEIHQEVVRLFDRQSYKQLTKFLKDALGQSIEGDFPVSITSDQGHTLERRETTEKSDYQRQLEEAIKGDPAFTDYVNTDNQLRTQVEAINEVLQNADPTVDVVSLTNLKQNLIGQRKAQLGQFISIQIKL